ncbi:hypothetical protein KAJ83_09010 [Marivibrio halodurans]|uniref:Uncharacterized protein n=1 Tax=Marivibrio halodurans TaxID=2039722 RepID=A0A8J7SM26_9PROT|nr:hypothetical protein [Marivibrio halodurans]MBP5857148.1 hypothetical protein [Marivibrio halodurans]
MAGRVEAADPPPAPGERTGLSIHRLTPEQRSRPDVARLIGAAIDFRLQGVNAPEALNERFAAAGTAPLALDNVRIGDRSSRLLAWRTFFRGSQAQMGGGLSETPLIGFYNPFVDYWLMTRWRPVADAPPKLISADLFPGAFLRDGKTRRAGRIPAAPEWLSGAAQAVDRGAAIGLRDALQESTALTLATFMARFPEASEHAPRLPDADIAPIMVTGIFSNRLSVLLSDIVDFARTDPLATAYDAVNEALRQDRPEGLADLAAPDRPIGTIDLLAEVPLPLREDLAPIAAYDLGRGWAVFSTPVVTARWPILGLFSAPGGGGARAPVHAVTIHDLYTRILGGA